MPSLRSIVIGAIPICSLAVAALVLTDATPDPIDSVLLQAAKDYGKDFSRASDYVNWAPLMCRGIQTEPALLSASPDPDTHGGKLYLLYARHDDEYVRLNLSDAAPDVSDTAPDSPFTATIGQTIVKETWTPREITLDEAASLRAGPHDHPLRLPTMKNGRAFLPDERRQLFIMHKLDPATPDTDDGWVYALVTPDASRVLAKGRIASCMECHTEAPHDRLFGLPRTQPAPADDASPAEAQ